MNQNIQEKKIVALGLVINTEGKILVTQRFEPEVPDAHLKWDLLGGTNEFGESLEETLIREISEEVGIDVKIIKMIPKSISRVWQKADRVMHTLVFCFECKLTKGEVAIRDKKIADFEWISREDLGKYEFISSSGTFLKDYFG
jgi:8-oxo-dGTP pyrophosphatase MutT (NUDIX family)